MSTYTHDIVATIGEYTDSQGNTKKRYQKCGAAFTNDEGDLSIKLDAIPVNPDWNGWLSLYIKREYDQQSTSTVNREPVRQVAAAGASGNQDDIPF